MPSYDLVYMVFLLHTLFEAHSLQRKCNTGFGLDFTATMMITLGLGTWFLPAELSHCE